MSLFTTHPNNNNIFKGMNSGVFMEKKKIGAFAKELEIEVQQCSSMMLDLEKVAMPFSIDANKMEIGAIPLESEKSVICRHTRKPCVLYNPGEGINYPSYIQYSHLDRCPSSKDSIEKYKLEGIKDDKFHVFKIRRVGK